MTIKKKKHSRKIVLDLTGPQGNAFCVLGNISRLMKQLGYLPADQKIIMDELTSGNYEHLIQVADKKFGQYIDFLR